LSHQLMNMTSHVFKNTMCQYIIKQILV
jgi:hypothetical protein